MTARPLSPKQQAFVREYLIDLNATAAARRAGYSERNADKIGPQLLGETRVAAAIQEAQQARAERTKITADYVLSRLQAEANRNGKGSSPAARVKALELLGRHLGLFEARRPVQVDVTSGGKPLERNSLTAADLAAAAALVGMAGLRVPANGGSQPLDPRNAAPQAAAVPPSG